jgi:hypothetical protein
MMAASFKSLYQKRPHESVQMRTAASRGAPDTALRLLVTDLRFIDNGLAAFDLAYDSARIVVCKHMLGKTPCHNTSDKDRRSWSEKHSA